MNRNINARIFCLIDGLVIDSNSEMINPGCMFALSRLPLVRKGLSKLK